MAVRYDVVAVAAITVLGLLYFGVQWVIAEVFPWKFLRDQKHGRPTVRTKSYAGRTALVTGANGAYGSRVSKMFAQRGVDVLVLVDVNDCSDLKKSIEDEVSASGGKKPEIIVWKIDFMTFAGCQELAKKAKTLENLDHALMTMGILAFNKRESPEGWETSIQVNYLSSALNGLLLLPLLKASKSNPSPPVLTFITSFGIYPASPTMSMHKTGSYLRHLSSNKDGMAQAHQYGRSKGLLLYFTRELAARVSAQQASGGKLRVTVNSADPGTAWTNLTAPNQSQLIPRLITNFGARDPQYGATAMVNGVSAGADSHGKIMMDFTSPEYPPFMNRSSGKAKQQRIWEETKAEFESKVPEAKSVYDMLDA